MYLKNIHNIEQVIKKNYYYKFLILNIEYDVDSEIALKCIAKDINDGTLSSLALEQFIKTTCVDGCDNVRKIISNYISTMNVNSDTISKTNTAIINNNASNPYITKKCLNMSSYNKNKTQQSLKNDKKFCFIICSNNKQYETECIRYINALNIPDDYSIEIIVVHNARGMTSAYNAAMLSSDANIKYIFIMIHSLSIKIYYSTYWNSLMIPA